MKPKTNRYTGVVLILGLLVLTNCAAPAGKEATQIPANTLSPQKLAEAFPLSVPGEYSVGIRRNIAYTDSSRG
jgi:hypothetical protein